MGLLDPLRTAVFRRERRTMPAPLPDDVRLFADADALLDAHPGLDPTSERLSQIARLHGLDTATAVFCRAQRRRHVDFCDRIDAPLPARLPRLDGRLVVVPAPQHDRLPGYGGDGALVRRVGEALGLRAEVAPLPSYAPLDENADRLAAHLAEIAEPVWLVSISKGSADVRTLFERRPEAAATATVWVSMCGLVGGTSLGALTPVWEQRLGAALMGVPSSTLAELGSGPGTRLGAPWTCPVPAVSLVPCPTEAHVTTRATRTRYRRLAALGPNDGACLLPEAVVPGSRVVPVWGVDHYFRHPHAARLLYGLFAALADELSPQAAAIEREAFVL